MSIIYYRKICYDNPGSTPENRLRTISITSDVTPDIVPAIVHALKVSPTLNLLKRLTTQKPESLGSDKPMPPAHIARPTSTEEAPAIPETIGPMIAEVVTKRL